MTGDRCLAGLHNDGAAAVVGQRDGEDEGLREPGRVVIERDGHILDVLPARRLADHIERPHQRRRRDRRPVRPRRILRVVVEDGPQTGSRQVVETRRGTATSGTPIWRHRGRSGRCCDTVTDGTDALGWMPRLNVHQPTCSSPDPSVNNHWPAQSGYGDRPTPPQVEVDRDAGAAIVVGVVGSAVERRVLDAAVDVGRRRLGAGGHRRGTAEDCDHDGDEGASGCVHGGLGAA